MNEGEAGRSLSPPPEEDEEGGDSVCWLGRVCDVCGALADGPSELVCTRCGSPRPAGPRT
jgi:hypothetical protein